MKDVMKKLFFGALLLCTAAVVFHIRSNKPEQSAVDLVIFSFDRPLQLYALLESVEKYVKGLVEKHVIYRVTGDDFDRGYEMVKNAFPVIQFHKQGSNPKADFKPLTLQSTFESPSQYVIFAVDDIVVKDTIDLKQSIRALERYQAYGVYLRLGKNLSHCYAMGSRAQAVPILKQEEPELFSWQFSQGQCDWAYPHTVDMTVYRKKDIENDLKAMAYYTPNSFEDMWNRRARSIMAKRGLCYEQSKIVNMPLNRVQHEYSNRAMNEYSAGDLLTLFLNGKKMDIAPLKGIDNQAAHMEYSPTFIKR